MVQSSDIVATHVRYVTSLVGAGIRVLSYKQEFQILAPGSKTMSLILPSQEEMNSWADALKQAIECTKQIEKLPVHIGAAKTGQKGRTNTEHRVHWHAGEVSKGVHLSSSNVIDNLAEGLGPNYLVGSNALSSSNADNKLGEGLEANSPVGSSQYEAAHPIPGKQVTASPIRSRSPVRDLQRQSKAMACLKTALDELEHIINNMMATSKQGAIHQNLTLPKLESPRQRQLRSTRREEPGKERLEDILASGISREKKLKNVGRSLSEPLSKSVQWQKVKFVDSEDDEHKDVNLLQGGGSLSVQTSTDGLSASSLEMSLRNRSWRYGTLDPVSIKDHNSTMRTSSLDALVSIPTNAGPSRSSMVQSSIMRQLEHTGSLGAPVSIPDAPSQVRSSAIQPSMMLRTSSIMRQGELIGNLAAPDSIHTAAQARPSAIPPSPMLQTSSVMRCGDLPGSLDALDSIPDGAGEARPSGIPHSSSIMKEGKLTAECLSKRFSIKPLGVEKGNGRSPLSMGKQAPMTQTNSVGSLVSIPASSGQARPSAIQSSMTHRASAIIRQGKCTAECLPQQFSIEKGKGRFSIDNAFRRDDGSIMFDQQMAVTMNDPTDGLIESSGEEEGDEDEDEVTTAVAEEARHSSIGYAANRLLWGGEEHQSSGLNPIFKQSLLATQNFPPPLKNSVVLLDNALQTQQGRTSQDGLHFSNPSDIPPVVGNEEYKLPNNRKSSVYSRAQHDFSPNVQLSLGKLVGILWWSVLLPGLEVVMAHDYRLPVDMKMRDQKVQPLFIPYARILHISTTLQCSHI